MALVACGRCGAITNPVHRACWSCDAQRGVATPPPLPAAKATGSGNGCLIAVMIWLALLLFSSFGHAETAIVRWAFGGAISLMLIVRFGFKLRHWAALGGSFWLGALLTVTLVMPKTRYTAEFEGFMGVWTIIAAAPLAIALALRKEKEEPRETPSRPFMPGPHNPPALAGDEDRIFVRLREIAEQQRRVERARELLRREDTGRTLLQVREKLVETSRMLSRQRSRHVARLHAIEVVRWQQQLADSLAPKPGEGNEARLERLARNVREGEALRRAIQREPEVAMSFEGERALSQLREVLARCEEVRQAILVEEARQALRGIDLSRDENRTTGLSSQPLESLQAALNASSLAAELHLFDAEHDRLREDDETARNVEHFLRELESGRM